ncbi:MAG: mandelate racemase/muconate lactonizing enzyme family protein [Planctomycetota bacterium]|nr:mandelate racemase/muconate lactonizing enzyme family protein [Planctomycetota bacterium]
MPETNSRRNVLKSAIAVVSGGILQSAISSQAALAEDEAARRDLKITKVKTFLLKHTLKKPFGVSVSVPLARTRTALLVKIETNAGLVGWGETGPISGARGTIDDHMQPILLGRNPLEYRKLWRSLWGANFGNGIALGAVEMALNDLRGKALGLPVAELFGGRVRDTVPVYASTMNYTAGREPEEQYPKQAADFARRGFKALKMRLGRYGVAREARVAKLVREAVGPSVKLMADGNGAYTLRTAMQMGRVLDELGFEFFEEPLPQSPRYAGYAELRQKLPLPLAGGEALDSRIAAKDLIDRRCIDIIQPDPALCGGIGEALFVAEMAALSRIQCIPHCWGGAIAIAASVHLASLLPEPHWGFTKDTPLLELDQSENPWRTELVKQPFEVIDGAIKVPSKPGLGIEVNEDVVEKYAQ